ncbi:MAG: glutathione S-transferase N-terminal domain-containing protein [Parvularculaceae bacterium]
MTRILYDLALADEDVRPSPFCWLVKFALLHKGLKFETRPVPFADKSKYPDAEYGKVPVLVDDGMMVKDSPVILDHLERKYRERPLAATPGERAAAAFYGAWLGASVYPALRPLIMLKLFHAALPADQAYFRQTRELRFGMSLEDHANAPDAPAQLEAALGVLAAPLAAHDFLGGREANLSDYTVMSPLMWQRCVTDAALYETPKPVAQWRERMLDLFDGYARASKSAG